MSSTDISAIIDKALSEGIIDGKSISQELRQEIKSEINDKFLSPSLGSVIVGHDSASELYVSMKEKACKNVGIRNTITRLSEDCTQEELETVLVGLNEDQKVNGILLQLPLPSHLNETDATTLINPKKDVDGLHYESVGKFQLGMESFIPCTPNGCLTLLKRSGVTLKGAHAVVIGRSNLVGRPMVRLLEKEHATVTLCHSRTNDLSKHTLDADIIIAAAGKANLITSNMVKNDAVIIDVGTNRVDGKLVGDVDFESVKRIAKLITPVPGGVGPMTIAMLLNNTLKSHKIMNNIS